jgi:hypothetical protein
MHVTTSHSVWHERFFFFSFLFSFMLYFHVCPFKISKQPFIYYSFIFGPYFLITICFILNNL